MGIETFPNVDPDTYVSPLEIVGRGWTPGAAGWRIATDPEFGRMLVRDGINLGTGAVQGSGMGFWRLQGGGANFLNQRVMFQAGSVVLSAPGSAGPTLQFDVAFPTDCLGVMAMFGDSPGVSDYWINAINRFGFRFFSGAGVAHRVQFFAIGY